MTDFYNTTGSVVTAGEINVNSIDLVVATKDLWVWHIDLNSKYASICGYSDNTLILCADEDTLKVNEDQRGNATVIEFETPESTPEWHWHTIVDCGRYTARFVAYRQPKLLYPVL